MGLRGLKFCLCAVLPDNCRHKKPAAHKDAASLDYDRLKFATCRRKFPNVWLWACGRRSTGMSRRSRRRRNSRGGLFS